MLLLVMNGKKFSDKVIISGSIMKVSVSRVVGVFI